MSLLRSPNKFCGLQPPPENRRGSTRGRRCLAVKARPIIDDLSALQHEAHWGFVGFNHDLRAADLLDGNDRKPGWVPLVPFYRISPAMRTLCVAAGRQPTATRGDRGLQKACVESTLGSNRPTNQRSRFHVRTPSITFPSGRQGSACCLSPPEPCWRKPRTTLPIRAPRSSPSRSPRGSGLPLPAIAFMCSCPAS